MLLQYPALSRELWLDTILCPTQHEICVGSFFFQKIVVCYQRALIQMCGDCFQAHKFQVCCSFDAGQASVITFVSILFFLISIRYHPVGFLRPRSFSWKWLNFVLQFLNFREYWFIDFLCFGDCTVSGW